MTRKTRKSLILIVALVALAAAPAFAGDWMAVGEVVSIQGEITVDGVTLAGIVIEDGAGTGRYEIDCPPSNTLPNACLDLDPGQTYELRGRIVPRAGGKVSLVLETAVPTVNTVPPPE